MAAAGAAWEEGWWGEPGTSATACTHHSHAMGTGICLRYGDWQQPGQHRRSQRLPLSPKKLSGGGDGSQPVPALAPTSPGLAPPLAPWISNQWDCSQSSAFSCCHPHEGQEHRTPAPTPLSPPPPGSVFLHLLDTAAPALCRAPCSRAGAGKALSLLTCLPPLPARRSRCGEGCTLPHSNLHSEGGGGRGGGTLQSRHSPGPDTPSSPETSLSSQQLLSREKGAQGLT